MIQHVALEVRKRNVSECERFWSLLGFERVEAPASLHGRATWMERRGTQIHLLYATKPSSVRQGHVAVVVDDYDATFGRLIDAEWHPDPRPEHWGAQRAFVRCPAGHLVEIMEFAPGAGA